jgi:hypothetical protein
MPFCAALADQNIARQNHLAAELLNAQPLRLRIAAVTAGALSLLMSHV